MRVAFAAFLALRPALPRAARVLVFGGIARAGARGLIAALTCLALRAAGGIAGAGLLRRLLRAGVAATHLRVRLHVGVRRNIGVAGARVHGHALSERNLAERSSHKAREG